MPLARITNPGSNALSSQAFFKAHGHEINKRDNFIPRALQSKDGGRACQHCFKVWNGIQKVTA